MPVGDEEEICDGTAKVIMGKLTTRTIAVQGPSRGRSVLPFLPHYLITVLRIILPKLGATGKSMLIQSEVVSVVSTKIGLPFPIKVPISRIGPKHGLL